MRKEDKLIISDEIVKTYELYGFEMSFTEFKDIFELGAEFGYQLALINNTNNTTPPSKDNENNNEKTGSYDKKTN